MVSYNMTNAIIYCEVLKKIMYSVSLEALREKIEIIRARMQQLGDEKGYTDTEVLKVSIELDDLLNEYQRRTSGFMGPNLN